MIMGFLLKSFIKLEGFFLKYSFDKLTKNPHSTQKKFLMNVLKKNADTEFGRKYNFRSIKTEDDFKKNVPISNYSDLKPYIDKITGGMNNVLTTDIPIIFNMTSGTTGDPKYIPRTTQTIKRTQGIMRQWLYRTLLDYPDFLNRSIFIMIFG